MLAPNRTPVASAERLKELGLDPTQYGSCSETRRVEIEGRGKVLINAGCFFYHICQERQKLMPDPDREHMRSRPRYVKTRIIKPAASGRGDTMRESYCACYQWYADLANRDGKNNELTEICGGEGDTFVMRGTSEEKRLDGTIAFKPLVNPSEPIPSFPDPTEASALSTDIATAAIKKSAADGRRQARRDARLGIGPEVPDQPETTVVQVDPEDVHAAFGKRG